MKFNFADHQEVDSLDTVPENFRVFYGQGDGESGAYKLRSDDPVVSAAVASISGLANSLNAARSDADRARKSKVDLSVLSEFGDTPEVIAEEFRNRLAEQAKAGGKDAASELQRLRDEMTKANQAALGERDTVIEGLRDQLFTQMVDSEAVRAIAEQKGVSELLMPFVRQQVKAVEEDGQMRVYSVDANRDRRYSGTSGNPMSIPELVSEMKSNARYGRLFESEAPRGTGMPPAQPRRAQPPKGELSSTEKIQVGLAAQVGARG